MCLKYLRHIIKIGVEQNGRKGDVRGGMLFDEEEAFRATVATPQLFGRKVLLRGNAERV